MGGCGCGCGCGAGCGYSCGVVFILTYFVNCYSQGYSPISRCIACIAYNSAITTYNIAIFAPLKNDFIMKTVTFACLFIPNININVPVF